MDKIKELRNSCFDLILEIIIIVSGIIGIYHICINNCDIVDIIVIIAYQIIILFAMRATIFNILKFYFEILKDQVNE